MTLHQIFLVVNYFLFCTIVFVLTTDQLCDVRFASNKCQIINFSFFFGNIVDTITLTMTTLTFRLLSPTAIHITTFSTVSEIILQN